MQRLILSILIVLYSLSLNAQSEMKKVYISKIVDHPALNATAKGIVDELSKSGYVKGKNLELKIESAMGSPVMAGAIAQKFVAQKPDVMVTIGTVASQAAAKYAVDGQVKLVFSSVTDPESAGLSNKNNITGVSNFVDLEPQLDLFIKMWPKLQTLGVIYNPGEANSTIINKKLLVLCKKKNIKLALQAASKSSDIMQATNKIITKVDALFISNDSTALSAIESIIKISSENKIPLFVSDTDVIKMGALAALGPNQYKIGLQTGAIISSILGGSDINKIEISYPDGVELFINEKVKSYFASLTK